MPLSFELAVFVLGCFVAAFVVGISGFAFAPVASAIWLLALPATKTPMLITLYGLIVQGLAVWRQRAQVDLKRVWPFVLGSAIGIPFGIALLKWLPASTLKLGIAVFFILFATFNLIRPRVPSMSWTGTPGDGLVGVLNGIVGAAVGFAGILVVIWSGMRDWSPAEQRAVFQPTAVATFLMCLAAFGGSGALTRETLQLFAIGLPALLLGLAGGWAAFGRIDDALFRRIVLWLLLLSGVAIITLSLIAT